MTSGFLSDLRRAARGYGEKVGADRCPECEERMLDKAKAAAVIRPASLLLQFPCVFRAVSVASPELPMRWLCGRKSRKEYEAIDLQACATCAFRRW